MSYITILGCKLFLYSNAEKVQGESWTLKKINKKWKKHVFLHNFQNHDKKEINNVLEKMTKNVIS